MQKLALQVLNRQQAGQQRSVFPSAFVKGLRGAFIFQVLCNPAVIGKHFKNGRQEDAHEFLRCLLETMQKSSLAGLPPYVLPIAKKQISWFIRKLDAKIKETTVIHQTFGGYLQSCVTCLTCRHESKTFDAFLDVCLELKGCDSVVNALKTFSKNELLSGNNRYKCERYFGIVGCVLIAKLQETRGRAQANEFACSAGHFDDSTQTFFLWHVWRKQQNQSFRGVYRVFGHSTVHEHANSVFSTPLDLRQGDPIKYKLIGVLVHAGGSTNTGHYFSFVRGSNGGWYRMDDDEVHQVKASSVLQQQGYILFYVREDAAVANGGASHAAKATDVSKASTGFLHQNSNGHADGEPIPKKRRVDVNESNGIIKAPPALKDELGTALGKDESTLLRKATQHRPTLIPEPRLDRPAKIIDILQTASIVPAISATHTAIPAPRPDNVRKPTLIPIPTYDKPTLKTVEPHKLITSTDETKCDSGTAPSVPSSPAVIENIASPVEAPKRLDERLQDLVSATKMNNDDDDDASTAKEPSKSKKRLRDEGKHRAIPIAIESLSQASTCTSFDPKNPRNSNCSEMGRVGTKSHFGHSPLVNVANAGRIRSGIRRWPSQEEEGTLFNADFRSPTQQRKSLFKASAKGG
jgi:hypothetical protein